MLTPTERQAIIDAVDAGEYDLEDALDNIATSQRGEDVRGAMYGGILLVNKEGKAGAVDVKARQKVDIAKADLEKQITALEKQMDEFIANQSGSTQATLVERVLLYSTQLMIPTNPDMSIVAQLDESMGDYDMIEIQYSAAGRTAIASFTPAQIRGTVHWSETVYNTPELSATQSPFTLLVFRASASDNDSISFSGYKYYWSGAADSTGNAVSADNSKIMSITGVKYTAVDTTAKDSELTDLRVGYDGTEYETAGAAVRAQIKALWDAVNVINVAAVTVDSNGYLRFDGGE